YGLMLIWRDRAPEPRIVEDRQQRFGAPFGHQARDASRYVFVADERREADMTGHVESLDGRTGRELAGLRTELVHVGKQRRARNVLAAREQHVLVVTPVDTAVAVDQERAVERLRLVAARRIVIGEASVDEIRRDAEERV